MNIFFRELKANFRSLLIWGGIAVLFVFIGMSKFSGYAGNPELLAILDSMPPAILAAFQMNAFNLTTITGFLGVMFSYFAIILSVAAIMWGTDIITKEERDKTVEFSLTMPVSRGKLITAKILAAGVNCFALAVITWVAFIFFSRSFQPDAEYYVFLNLVIIALFLIQMIFLAVGIFLGCAMKQHKRASSVAVSILLVTFFISIIAGLKENLDFLEYFSPFMYFSAAELLQKSSINLANVWLSVGIIAVLIAGAYVTYSRRDLYI